MGLVRHCFVKVGPAQKAPCPVSLAGLMALTKLIEVCGTVGFVQRICAIGTTIVSQTRCYRYTSASEEKGLSIMSQRRLGGAQWRCRGWQ